MSKKCTVTKALLWASLLCLGTARAGEVAGTVMQLSGPMMAKKADGKVKILALKSEIESGDTLVTEKNTYALVKFIDNSEITLKPATILVVEQFAFKPDQPDADRASFSLLTGGLRSQSGMLGKRNREKFALKTPVATIGIHGTNFIVQYLNPAAGPVAPAATAPVLPVVPTPVATGLSPGVTQPPGLYVQVLAGQIYVGNTAGQQNFSAGQFGFTPTSVTAPVVVPPTPAIQFSPPPVFQSTASVSAVPSTSNGVNCVVQ